MSNGTVDTMLGIIPVVITGGILLKFAEAITPKRDQILARKLRKKRSTYSRNFSGNFANVGY